MTLSEMRTEIWEMLGEPTDLDPSTDTSYGGSPWLNWVINEAQRQVATWRDPETGKVTRMRNLYNIFYFKMFSTDGTFADAGSTTTEVILPAATVGDGDDRYNGWILETGGEERIIMDYVTATRTATVHEAFTTAPSSGDTFTLYKNFYLLLPSSHAWADDHISLPAESDEYRATGNLVDVIKISDLNDETELRKARSGENFITRRTSIGDPRSWYRFGNRLVFDNAVDDDKWLEIEYYRLPFEMTADSDECELPEQYHYAVVLWGVVWGLRRDHENTEKYSVWRELVEFMRRVNSQYDMEWERDHPYGRLEI
jgi:hypothetical protein